MGARRNDIRAFISVTAGVATSMAKAQCARLTKFIIPTATRPDRQQEEEHPVGEPIEQDAEDGPERHGMPPTARE